MSAQYDEGHTVAGWTGFGVASVAAVVVGVGVCAVSAALVAVGLGVGVVSVLVTWVLHLAGWGKPPGRRPREQWGMRVRDSAAREGHAGCLGCRMAGRGRRTAAVATPVAAVGEPEGAAAAESVG
ncbi:hypothetical protein OHA71_26780 [Streptomyces sp. NBC_00444]|uniref:HGxxPAAW family protein n=1 Tax=Streptomyces sp. NBC_00444 TaxID=2975744 RepID=UPI002E1F357F